MHTDKDIAQLQLVVVFKDNTGKRIGLSSVAQAVVAGMLGVHVDEKTGDIGMYSDHEIIKRFHKALVAAKAEFDAEPAGPEG